jgi:peroxiredoxin
MTRWFVLSGLLFAAVTVCAQQANTSPAKLIDQRIHKLRSLADDVRAVETRNLAREIRALDNHNDELILALALSNFATEGDFGSDTLRDVVATIADAIPKVPTAPDSAYNELARLIHYERVGMTFNDPRLAKAIARLDDVDKIRQQADFTLQDLTGKSWTLKQLHGKVVLVNFWATWCPPCRKEMPDLETLHKRFAGKGLVILAISDEDDAKVRPFIAEKKYTYPILLDAESAVNKRFLIQGIPKTLVFDASGKLAAQSSDMRTMGQFLEMLKQARLGL